mmetsp:Transcript_28007/g.63386  ORF Transcript_28007/g.63386 Transcript_28007/m.63386 type:complete len:342 (-) Transcript_28007:79-1104(-)
MGQCRPCCFTLHTIKPRAHDSSSCRAEPVRNRSADAAEAMAEVALALFRLARRGATHCAALALIPLAVIPWVPAVAVIPLIPVVTVIPRVPVVAVIPRVPPVPATTAAPLAIPPPVSRAARAYWCPGEPSCSELLLNVSVHWHGDAWQLDLIVVLGLHEQLAHKPAEGRLRAVTELAELLAVFNKRLEPSPQLLGVTHVTNVENSKRTDVRAIFVVEQALDLLPGEAQDEQLEEQYDRGRRYARCAHPALLHPLRHGAAGTLHPEAHVVAPLVDLIHHPVELSVLRKLREVVVRLYVAGEQRVEVHSFRAIRLVWMAWEDVRRAVELLVIFLRNISRIRVL